MSPGTDLGNAYLVVNSTGYHNRLCALDVLGLEDKPTSHQSEVREEFKEQLTGSPDGRYETGLPWKGNCPELPNNCTGSVRRVNSLLRKLTGKPLHLNIPSVANWEFYQAHTLSQG